MKAAAGSLRADSICTRAADGSLAVTRYKPTLADTDSFTTIGISSRLLASGLDHAQPCRLLRTSHLQPAFLVYQITVETNLYRLPLRPKGRIDQSPEPSKFR